MNSAHLVLGSLSVYHIIVDMRVKCLQQVK